jgi:CRISPR-associated protein Cmr3
VQVLPHIDMQDDCRQVKDADGYFTEVAMRLRPGWSLTAALNEKLQNSVVRLGGEGHRAMVRLLWDGNEAAEAPALAAYLKKLSDPASAPSAESVAYLATPGLAQVEPAVYGSYPHDWKSALMGCATDKQLLWGGVSKVERKQTVPAQPTASDTGNTGVTKKLIPGFLPQRAFVPPGTVYVFKTAEPGLSVLPTLSQNNNDPKWLKTFHALNYGKLLWGK